MLILIKEIFINICNQTIITLYLHININYVINDDTAKKVINSLKINSTKSNLIYSLIKSYNL